MITVLGATGNTGRRITAGLLAAGRAVRAVGRDADRLAPAVAGGAEPRVGDLRDRRFLAAAFAGADAAYVLLPFDPLAPGYAAHQAAMGAAIAGALADAGVPRVVALSSLGAELADGTGLLTALHDQEERLTALAERGTELLVLRPGLFFESFAPALATMLADGGHVDTVDPRVALPMVATRDVADAAVDALLSPRRVHGVVELLGPADLTFGEAVAGIGHAHGRDLTYTVVPDGTMRPILLEVGVAPDVVDGLLAMNAAFSRGAVRSRAGRGPASTGPTGSTGSTGPTTVRAWAATLTPA